MICESFKGTPSEIVPEIIMQGYYPISVKGLLEKRLESYNTSTKEFWLENTFTTGSIGIYHKDGRMKLLSNPSQIKNVLSDLDGVINIMFESDDMKDRAKMYAKFFKQLEGREFSKKDDKKYASRRVMIYEDIIKNPIWLELAENDKALLSDYAKMIISESKKSRAMGVIAKNELEPSFDLRLCKLHGIYTTRQGMTYYSDVEIMQDINSETNILAYENKRRDNKTEITSTINKNNINSNEVSKISLR